MLKRQKQILLNWIISSLLLTVFFTAVFLVQAIPSSFDQYIVLRGLSDGFFAAAAVELLGTALILIGRSGIFDTAAFGFVVLGENLKKDATHKYKDAYDYKTQTQEKRNQHKPFLLPYVILGSSSLILAVCFTVLSYLLITK